MSSFLDQPTVGEQLTAYLESEDLEMDIKRLDNEYRLDGCEVPPREKLREEAIKEQREWLENRAMCESEGHIFHESTDGENGVSNLDCDRCGIHFRCQW